MALKTMFITNNPQIAQIAENHTVDFIFVDLETMGKEARQPNMDTVKSQHTFDDISSIKTALKKAQLLVRVNPLHQGSSDEINEAIARGADVLMLPMFRTASDAETFVSLIKGRTEVMLLAETPEAQANISAISQVAGVDSIHIGINDLHLAQKKKFMFELLVDGTVAEMCQYMGQHPIRYGFGGTSRLGHGLLPAQHIIAQHYHLGSQQVILSRDFCDLRKITTPEEIEETFALGMGALRAYEQELATKSSDFFLNNEIQMRQIIQSIVESR